MGNARDKSNVALEEVKVVPPPPSNQAGASAAHEDSSSNSDSSSDDDSSSSDDEYDRSWAEQIPPPVKLDNAETKPTLPSIKV